MPPRVAVCEGDSGPLGPVSGSTRRQGAWALVWSGPWALMASCLGHFNS
jgi:hypothetical protein